MEDFENKIHNVQIINHLIKKDHMKIKFLLLVLFFSNSAFSNYKLETVLDDLDDAWSFVFLEEDKILFTEMPGKLKIASLSDKSIT